MNFINIISNRAFVIIFVTLFVFNIIIVFYIFLIYFNYNFENVILISISLLINFEIIYII